MLGGLVYLARALIAAFAVLLIGGHNLFDALRAEDLKAWGRSGRSCYGGGYRAHLDVDDRSLLSARALDRGDGARYALGLMLQKGTPRRLLLRVA